MATPIENIRKERIKKVQELRNMGVNPYPAKVKRSHSNSEVIEQFETLLKAEKEVLSDLKQSKRVLELKRLCELFNVFQA